MAIDNNVMGWNDMLDNDKQEFVVLPEGDYLFTVTGFERGQYQGGPKIPACPKAVLTLTIDNDQGPATARVILLLHRQVAWKVSDFFISIGQMKRNEKASMNWNQVLGARGKGHFRPREYTSGDGEIRKINDLERFIDYDPREHMTAVEDAETPW